MSIFSRKERVILSEFCTSYYDTQFINPVLAGMDMAEAYNQVVSDNITQVDTNFQSIDKSLLNYNLLLLRFELFALAWFHKFGIEMAVSNSIFTRDYLESISRLDIWEDCLSYNHAISKSATYGYDSSTALGRVKLLDVNKTKVDQFKKYQENGFDTKCVARVLNRYGTESSWKRMVITHALLVNTLYERIGHDLNEEATFIFISTLKGFYDGATDSLANKKIIS